MPYYILDAALADPKRIKKEREKAQKLKKSSWWQNRIREGICHYCQGKFPPKELTMDHIVPIARGGSSTQGNVVPSCRACNQGFQIDDEYFRATLLARYGVDESPIALDVLQRLLRGLDRPQGKGLTTALVESVGSRDFWSEHGVNLGPQPALTVNAERIHRTLGRIVRALYWDATRIVMPVRIEVKAHLQLDFDRKSVGLLEKILAGASLRSLGSAFSYAWREVPEYPFFTAWLLDFYGSAAQYSVFTSDPLGRPEELSAADA